MHLSKKRLLIVPSLVLLVVGVVGVSMVTLWSSLPTTHELYDYSDETSLSPTLQVGGRVEVNWQGYPDADLYRDTKPAYATEDIHLSVLLVPEAAFQQGVCGRYAQAQILDELRTTNRTGASSYQRSVQLPSRVRSGVYELVRQVSSPVRAACFSNRVLLGPPRPRALLVSHASVLIKRHTSAVQTRAYKLICRL